MVSRSIRSKFLSSSSSLSSASTSSTASAATTVTPSFSYDGMRFDLPSLAEETGSDLLSPITGEDEDENDSDWLLDAETCMRQDLVTSQREFELAKEILDALKLELVEAKMEKKPGPHSLKLEDQVFLLSACQEYSGSRCHMLEERLRQIQMWSDEGQMGHDIPTGVPDEWQIVDTEWREWLSEQATFQSNELDRVPVQCPPIGDIDLVVKDWGPLIPILTAYIE